MDHIVKPLSADATRIITELQEDIEDLKHKIVSCQDGINNKIEQIWETINYEVPEMDRAKEKWMLNTPRTEVKYVGLK